MRFTLIFTLICAATLLVFASTGVAQDPVDPPPAQRTEAQQQSSNPAAPGQQPVGPVVVGAAMMNPGMMQMMGPMPQGMGGRGRGSDGPLQRVSRLLTALDDPRVRTMLGLSEQQAESLRKIVVDTEIFTIKTGAVIAVDAIDLRELLRADNPDKAVVMSKGDEISKSTSQLINRYLEAALAAKALLTPAQQKMIRAYLESGALALPVPPPPPARP